ncbi:MAG TPA: hypothetical protein VFH24_05880 [Gemmatimonadales bacterium]|nr:hypothetical protein [Gemmatimonadales bacterium]
MRQMLSCLGIILPGLVLPSCTRHQSPTPPQFSLARAESLYADLRDIRDRFDVNLEARPSAADDGTRQLITSHNEVRDRVAAALAAVDSAALPPDDARALGIMRRTLAADLRRLDPPAGAATSTENREPECAYRPEILLASQGGLDSLRRRMYACYSWAQSHVLVDGDTLDRLSVLGALGRTESAERRKQLFLALDPVWRSVNRGNEAGSPYRLLIAREISERGGAEPPAATQLRASGLRPDSLEQWLVRVLETWRDVTPDSLTQPWDWYFETGRASRRLSPSIPKERLKTLNDEIYRSLGANIEQLGVRYDLEPRPGKTPVAYCTFGLRQRFLNGSWRTGEPWVFATYRSGGLDNLNELLHETGHAVHISAIRTRPGFADWPDSDPFTEAVADFIALDVYEPVWQQHWLGDSVPTAESLRSRYGGIVLDIAWALFEVRMQRNPHADPNEVWTVLTRDYLRIRPHPELSWWAMRGQLIDAPGYMMNYAAGAIIIADIRQRTRDQHRPFVTGDSTWYGWVAPRLFRFGLERPTRIVLEKFLGRAVSPAALLHDMQRMKVGRRN